MNKTDFEYLNLLKKVLFTGIEKSDRTGTGTISSFGHQMQFGFSEGFPILTSKYIHFKSVMYELLWFLSGSDNIQYLHDNNVTIWDEWADKDGYVGPIYGFQWRNWAKFSSPESPNIWKDQINNLILGLHGMPESRRHIVTAWNPSEIKDMALPPCHLMFQMNVQDSLTKNTKLLSCHMYQRSADMFLGVPFNISSYALLTEIIADFFGWIPYKLIISFGDCHVYKNHLDQCEQILECLISKNSKNKEGTRKTYNLPKLKISSKSNKNMEDINEKNVIYRFENYLKNIYIGLEDYNHAGRINAKVSV